ncbi:MAG: formyltetrahydrofolate deformylase [Candidatus Omnitrophica bacterium]|nr:formyltetrahydrofolate deformylase [Candidatus Omnitrophota bacterium]
MHTFILLFQCQDRLGIVAKISDFILRQGGNIISADQYTTDPQGGFFFMRVEFLLESGGKDQAGLEQDFLPIAKEFNAKWNIYDKLKRLRMGICVSKPGHCLADILYLWKTKELFVDIPFIVSNYAGHQELVEQYKIPFYYLAASREERKESDLLKIISQQADFLVLARYMLVLSPEFLKGFGRDIINIHHGFLPSFKGAKPYHQALEEGVKVIGATSHFVTEKLDIGPIISQAVEPVSHKDDLDDLVRKGRNLEKKALSEALHAYIDYRVIKHNHKTIVF